MKIILTLILIGSSYLLNAQSIVGKWKTVDDNTGKERSIVEIYKKGEKYFGKILKIIPDEGEDPNPICEECKGKKKNMPVVGMEIITDMKKKGKEYVNGEILDPENGKVYDCKLWIEDGNLKVRGFVWVLYRTQTWLPAD